MLYTTWGPVRGDCGHAHKTWMAASACLTKDAAGCAKQGGYSDREVRQIESKDELRSYDVTRGPGQRMKWDEEE